MIQHGPVDVVVLAAGEPRFDGAVFAELKRQAGYGTIRVLDAMILLKDEQGVGASLDLEDLPEEQRAAVGFIETGTRGLFDSQMLKLCSKVWYRVRQWLPWPSSIPGRWRLSMPFTSPAWIWR